MHNYWKKNTIQGQKNFKTAYFKQIIHPYISNLSISLEQIHAQKESVLQLDILVRFVLKFKQMHRKDQ